MTGFQARIGREGKGGTVVKAISGIGLGRNGQVFRLGQASAWEWRDGTGIQSRTGSGLARDRYPGQDRQQLGRD